MFAQPLPPQGFVWNYCSNVFIGQLFSSANVFYGQTLMKEMHVLISVCDEISYVYE